MTSALHFLAQCIWYLLPMGFANMAPVFMRNTLGFLAIPVDNFTGRRGIFGSHKTLRGVVVAIPFGLVAFIVQQGLSIHPWFAALGFFQYSSMSLWFGLLAGFGAIMGDIVRSAIKRRMRVRPGGKFVPFDQLDYLVGGMLFTSFLFRPSLTIIVVTLIAGGLLHALTSWIAYLLGLKKDKL